MDGIIIGSIILSAVIYLIYFFYVSRDCSCGCSEEEKEKSEKSCGKCHENSEETNNFM